MKKKTNSYFVSHQIPGWTARAEMQSLKIGFEVLVILLYNITYVLNFRTISEIYLADVDRLYIHTNIVFYLHRLYLFGNHK